MEKNPPVALPSGARAMLGGGGTLNHRQWTQFERMLAQRKIDLSISDSEIARKAGIAYGTLRNARSRHVWSESLALRVGAAVKAAKLARDIVANRGGDRFDFVDAHGVRWRLERVQSGGDPETL